MSHLDNPEDHAEHVETINRYVEGTSNLLPIVEHEWMVDILIPIVETKITRLTHWTASVEQKAYANMRLTEVMVDLKEMKEEFEG